MAKKLSEKLRAKLSAHLEDQGIGLGRFEDIHGLKHDAFKSFLTPSRLQVPSLDKAHDLCVALGLDLRIVDPEDESPVSEDYAMIGVEAAVASAGTGLINPEEQQIGHLAFRRSWLKRLGININKAALIRVKGNSMSPTLPADCVVLLDLQRTDPVRGQVYAFVQGDELRVKRLNSMPGKYIHIVSDNPQHPPEMLSGRDMNSIRVIGRVVWAGHQVGEIDRKR